MKNMINKVNGKRELARVNMLIRAISDEMTQEQDNSADSTQRSIPEQVQEALYELRLRKLCISALVSSDRAAKRNISH
jgi:hypothetical protein